MASGKGGVGKSTVSANLAVALSKLGYSVGLVDLDIYGPSMSLMFGTKERPGANENDEFIPVTAHGVKLLSMGLLINESDPVAVRGPLATRYVQQFLRNVAWGDVDFLILDLPPGTGDIQLTIVQTAELDGVVVVTTPQDMDLLPSSSCLLAGCDQSLIPILSKPLFHQNSIPKLFKSSHLDFIISVLL